MSKLKKNYLNKNKLPLVLEPDTAFQKQDLAAVLKAEEDLIKEGIREHGGVLLRNFPMETADDFAEALRVLDLGKGIDYIGGDSPRTKVKDHIYTSTEAPPSIKIPLHNELSFVKNYPRYIMFFCEVAPQEKGETIIGDARKIYQSIDPKIREKFASKGLKYISRYYYKSKLMDAINSLQKGHKTWLDVFETEDKKKVEQLCLENEFAYKWNQNDWLEISQVRPAAMAHPETNEMVWFNQAHLYDYNPRLLGFWRYLGAQVLYARKYMLYHEIFYADGSKIDRQDLYHVMDKLDENTIAFPWRKGDLMILDNVLAMHGRAAFTGKRRVLTAMAN